MKNTQSHVYNKVFKIKEQLKKIASFHTLVVLLLNLLIVFISLYLCTAKGCGVKTAGALLIKLMVTAPVVSSPRLKKGILITFNKF